MSSLIHPAIRHHLTPGGRVRLISLRGGEVALVRPVFDGLSERSRWLRFHTGMPSVPPRYLEQLARVVPGHRHVLLAVAPHGPVGHAEWTRLPGTPSRAEVAVAVVDAAHGQGVGLALVEELAHSAAAQGISQFTCSALRENRPVRQWLDRCDARVDPSDPTECTFAITDLVATIASHAGRATPPPENPLTSGDRGAVA